MSKNLKERVNMMSKPMGNPSKEIEILKNEKLELKNTITQ